MQTVLVSIVGLLAVGFGNASPARPTSSRQTPSGRVLYQHPSPADAWLEVMTDRNNGELLVTRYDAGEIWTVSPKTGKGSLVYKFPESAGVNSTIGINQYQDDVFAFVGGRTQGGLSGGFPVQGAWGVYSLDLRGWKAGGKQEPQVSLITSIPDAMLLNGLTVLSPAIFGRKSGSTPTILVAESSTGSIFSIDTATNETSLFYSNPIMAPPAENAYPNGINGLKLPPIDEPDYVYFTVGGFGTFYRLALANGTAEPAPGAEPELLLDEESSLDDFTLDKHSTAYIANVGGGRVIRLTADGNRTVFLEGDILASATSTVLAKKKGKDVLYVSAGSRGATLEESSPGRVIEITF
ncbi:hypothetical protein EsH8_VII_000120 [Colletotrichum jinshuiense]